MSGIMFNEDNSHFCYTRANDGLSEEGVDRFLDPYIGTSVKEMVFCVNAQRTGYATQAEGWEPIWADIETGPAWWRDWPWPNGAKTLHDRGVDRFARWIDRCRAERISPWLSIRTNDVHATDDLNSPMHSHFWKKHHGFWRVDYRFEQRTDRALDYGRPEVRQRLLALVSELAERYDVDGLEIDWVRTEFVFRPGHEAAGAPLLTDMMKRIREVLNKWEGRRGHRIALSVRVPPHPLTCRHFGLEPVQWAREGLISAVALSPHIHVFNDTPVDLWKDLLHGTDVLICPGADIRVWAHPRAARVKNGAFTNTSLPIVRGLAAAYLHRGADRVYFFNLFDSQTALCDQDMETYRNLLCDAGELERLVGRARRHVVTFCDSVAPGDVPSFPLPRTCGPHGDRYLGSFAFTDTAAFRIYTGPAPRQETVHVCLAFGDSTRRFGYRATIPQNTEVRVNGELCTFAGRDEVPEPTPEEELWAYAVPDGAMQEGYNLVEVLPRRATTVTWAEIAFLG